MSLSKRVSYETLNEFKTEVAYQVCIHAFIIRFKTVVIKKSFISQKVRFEKTRTKHTKILFLTEGVLLRQMQTDPNLMQYDLIVVDEVHERHVFTDFLLGILKCLVRQRSDLKIILMSATINIDLFSNYFNDCVIVKVGLF
jgi:HrpA-like RNA helicase